MSFPRAAAPVVILGATATGKSALAVALGRCLQGEVVSADSMQVYRGFDIGTAKLGLAARLGVPHHLLDVADPRQDFSAGDFLRAVEDALREIAGRGRTALIVGGSGFYLRAWLHGLAPIPRPPSAIRRVLLERAATEGMEVLHRELASADPVAAARLSPNDRQRVVRALEVYAASGRTLTQWWSEPRLPPRTVVKFGLRMERAELYRRIAERTRDIFETGLVGECEGLLAAGVPRGANAWNAIGYRQALAVIDGDMTLEVAIEATGLQTRRLAKRQETWFRAESGVTWIDVSKAENAEEPCATIMCHLTAGAASRGAS